MPAGSSFSRIASVSTMPLVANTIYSSGLESNNASKSISECALFWIIGVSEYSGHRVEPWKSPETPTIISESTFSILITVAAYVLVIATRSGGLENLCSTPFESVTSILYSADSTAPSFVN